MITLIADQWATEDRQGFANEIFRRLSSLTGIMAELEIYPINHAVHLMSNQHVSCFFGGTKDLLEKYSHTENLSLIDSDTITGDSVYAFTKRNTPVIQSFAQLAEKSIVATSVTYDQLEKLIPNDIYRTLSLTETNTIQQGIRLVEADRADVFIRFRSTLADSFDREFHYDSRFVLYSTNDKIVCHKSELTVSYLETMNKAINLGLSNGSLTDIYEKYHRLTPDELVQ